MGVRTCRGGTRRTPIAQRHGIDLLANEYQTYDSMSAREYRDAVPINLNYLSE
jgi:hypothetical protein